MASKYARKFSDGCLFKQLSYLVISASTKKIENESEHKESVYHNKYNYTQGLNIIYSF